jgi:polysaccharide export outer membrane protein
MAALLLALKVRNQGLGQVPVLWPELHHGPMLVRGGSAERYAHVRQTRLGGTRSCRTAKLVSTGWSKIQEQRSGASGFRGDGMRKVAIKLGALLSVAVLAPAMRGQTAATTKGASVTSPAMAAPEGNSDYVIGADDTLHISVWKEPDLSETLPVRPDGKISLPLLGDVTAAGMTPSELGDSVKEKLKKYVDDPRVTVVVTAMNSRRIFVTGEVTHSGAMPLLPNMTMLQALAAAGFTQFANLKAIYLLRNEGGRQVKYRFNYKDVVKGRHQEQNIPLRPGDTVVVP